MSEAAAIKGKCPICGRPVTIAFRPFCSSRCADIDLARWLGGAYVVPGDPHSDEEDSGDPLPQGDEK